MPQTVVHEFEAVEVDVNQGYDPRITLSGLQGLIQPVGQEPTIRKSSKLVRKCLTLQLHITRTELCDHLVELVTEEGYFVVGRNCHPGREILSLRSFLHSCGKIANCFRFLFSALEFCI